MALREEITKSRNEMYDDVATASNQEDIEHIIDRVDEISERVDRLELKLFNMSANASQPPALPPTIPEEVLQDAIEVFKATVAEKKRELAKKPADSRPTGT